MKPSSWSGDSPTDVLGAESSNVEVPANFEDTSWMGDQDRSRITTVLQLLRATLRGSSSTRSLSGTCGTTLEIEIPKTVGRFEIGECVGRGGFGAVYRAHDPLLGRYVAVKAVPRRAGMSSIGGDYRLREARAAARLNHTNLVPLYEVLDDEDFVYLISEFCEGPTLQQFLNGESAARPIDSNLGNQKVSVAWAAAITIKLGSAIAHCA